MALRIAAFVIVLFGGVAASVALHVRQENAHFQSHWQPGVLPPEWELGAPFAILVFGIAVSAAGPCAWIRYQWAILFGLAGAYVAWSCSEFFPSEIQLDGRVALTPWRDNRNTILFGLMSWFGLLTVPLWGLLWGLDWINAQYRSESGERSAT